MARIRSTPESGASLASANTIGIEAKKRCQANEFIIQRESW